MKPNVIPGWEFVLIFGKSLAIYANGNDRMGIDKFGYGQVVIEYKFRK